jgi:hypothetical protein
MKKLMILSIFLLSCEKLEVVVPTYCYECTFKTTGEIQKFTACDIPLETLKAVYSGPGKGNGKIYGLINCTLK